jgi:hypothetical protein
VTIVKGHCAEAAAAMGRVTRRGELPGALAACGPGQAAVEAVPAAFGPAVEKAGPVLPASRSRPRMRDVGAGPLAGRPGTDLLSHEDPMAPENLDGPARVDDASGQRVASWRQVRAVGAFEAQITTKVGIRASR